MSAFEFDSAYSAVTGEHVQTLYIPTVEHDEYHDVLIDGLRPEDTSTWKVLTGYTSQDGYRGAVMHPSENADDDTLRGWVTESGGDVFAIVAVLDPESEDGDAIGWAVLYLPTPVAGGKHAGREADTAVAQAEWTKPRGNGSHIIGRPRVAVELRKHMRGVIYTREGMEAREAKWWAELLTIALGDADPVKSARFYGFDWISDKAEIIRDAAWLIRFARVFGVTA